MITTSSVVKTVLAVCAAVVLAACQPVAFNPAPSSETSQADSDTIMPGSEISTESNETSSGRYVEYSPAAYEAAQGQRRVLFFYANWCPTCRPADVNLMQNINQIPEDVTVLRVNYNDSDTDQNEQELADAYDVTYQHTYVQIDADGNLVGIWNGGQIEELLSNLKNP